MIIYFLSFSVLFAFFPPIFSYDEPLQYCFIFAGLASYVKRQWMGYVLWFTAAMIARENTALLIVGLALSAQSHFPSFRKMLRASNLRSFTVIGLPILLYLIFFVFFIETYDLWKGTRHEFSVRFLAFRDNFQDIRSSIETVASILLTLGTFSYFLINSNSRHSASETEKRFIKAFILTCVLNTIIVLIAAFAREARLFSLPLVFLWPLMAQYCSSEIKLILNFKIYRKCFAKWKYGVSFIIIGWSTILFPLGYICRVFLRVTIILMNIYFFPWNSCVYTICCDTMSIEIRVHTHLFHLISINILPD